MSQPLYPRERALVPIVQEDGWASGLMWTDEKILQPLGFWPKAIFCIAVWYTDFSVVALHGYHQTENLLCMFIQMEMSLTLSVWFREINNDLMFSKLRSWKHSVHKVRQQQNRSHILSSVHHATRVIICCPNIFMCISFSTSLDPSTYIIGAGHMSFYTILQADARILLIHESSSRFTGLSVSGCWAANELRPQSWSLR
jgi:hypothetical protein